VVSGLLAGAVGTASIDSVRYLMYRRGGGQDVAGDLVAHLAYGAGTGSAFWALAGLIRMAGSPAEHPA